MTVGLLHPGEMGAAVGDTLREAGQTVLWASAGRSAETAGRAMRAGLEDVGTAEELARRSAVILSVCPPHAALEVAQSVAGLEGVFVDANAVSPVKAREIGRGLRFVDGGIIGPPPRARELVEAGAKEALSNLKAVEPYDPGKPCEIKVEYKGTTSPAKLRYRAGVELLDARTIVSRADDWWTAWKQFFF